MTDCLNRIVLTSHCVIDERLGIVVVGVAKRL
jgi:hypothetical protein